MNYYSLQLIFSLLCLSLYFLNLCFSCHRKSKLNKLPPGPKPLPILGNILQLSNKPHRAFAELSKIYGPLMYLKLGSVHTLVVSSSTMAREVFVKHDLAFSSRKVVDAVKALDHHLHSVAWLPVSPKRQNITIHLFSVKSLNATEFIRQKKVHELVDYIKHCCMKGESVDIGEVGFTTSLNLLSSTLFSTNIGAGYNSEVSQGFKDIVRQIFDCIGKPNLADFFPLLSYFDPLGVRKGTVISVSKLFDVFDDIISQRSSVSGANYHDLLQTLLDISKEDSSSDLSLDAIKHLLADLIAAGTDTTSNTLEWAMAELLSNPSKMRKAQAELDEILGKDTIIKESDVERLPYLKAIVKETMRLHPAVPLLIPRKATDNIQLCEYIIPKDTLVLVNTWAIGRDPEIWKNPSEFLPERFLECDIDIKGRDFELIPFGAGRRLCLGLPLAYRMLHLMLATILHGFKWRLEDGLRNEDLDMNERFGTSLQKAKPLIAIPFPK